MDYKIYYELIPEDDVQIIVEEVYKRPIYYECVVDNTDAKFSAGNLITRRKTSVLIPTADLILRVLSPMVKCTSGNSVLIFSPVDMTKYNKWNFLLEDCLYYSPRSYIVGERDEVRCVRIDQS